MLRPAAFCVSRRRSSLFSKITPACLLGRANVARSYRMLDCFSIIVTSEDMGGTCSIFRVKNLRARCWINK